MKIKKVGQFLSAGARTTTPDLFQIPHSTFKGKALSLLRFGDCIGNIQTFLTTRLAC